MAAGRLAMPLVEVRKLAIRSGWPRDTNVQTASDAWIKFTDALRQAAVNSTFTTYGRPERSSFPEIVASEPLQKIGAEYSLHFKIDTLHFLSAEENLINTSYNQSKPAFGSFDVGRFRDLRVDRVQAMKWLETLAIPQ